MSEILEKYSLKISFLWCVFANARGATGGRKFLKLYKKIKIIVSKSRGINVF
jgi:hypothetical protein